jgi:hypothetical protein
LLPEAAVQWFAEAALADQCAEFVTLPACERMPQRTSFFDVAFSVGVAFSADNAENTTSTENTTGSWSRTVTSRAQRVT